MSIKNLVNEVLTGAQTLAQNAIQLVDAVAEEANRAVVEATGDEELGAKVEKEIKDRAV